ncbi:hypothetical protein B0H16DRAFT_1724488 [Mycena metata]|uniref:RRM domain-containing protein n=1 Tax=Mycena metata TaxID=1033252 RepID=A0AAD7IU23_9AGAR|nr:hypothetical protein B0H16DRAFT_1724488 [Mycena metata]
MAMNAIVYVENIPRDVDEATMIDIFETVGPVIGFRIATDRQTGKSNGYGFCDFYGTNPITNSNNRENERPTDKETAAAAVGQLNNISVNGHTLRIGMGCLNAKSPVTTATKQWLSKNDLPTRPDLQYFTVATTKPTSRKDPILNDMGPLDGSLTAAASKNEPGSHSSLAAHHKGNEFLAHLPPGIPLAEQEQAKNRITTRLAAMTESHITEILANTKTFIFAHPKEAHKLFQHHPQFTYAIVMALVLSNTYPPEAFTITASTNSNTSHPKNELSEPKTPFTALWNTSGPRITPDTIHGSHPPSTSLAPVKRPRTTDTEIKPTADYSRSRVNAARFRDETKDTINPIYLTLTASGAADKDQLMDYLPLIDNVKPADIVRIMDTTVQMPSYRNSPLYDDLGNTDDQAMYSITRASRDGISLNSDCDPRTNNTQAAHEPQSLSRLLPLLDHLRMGTGSKEDAQDLWSIISVLTPPQIEVLPDLDQATIKAIHTAFIGLTEVYKN